MEFGALAATRQPLLLLCAGPGTRTFSRWIPWTAPKESSKYFRRCAAAETIRLVESDERDAQGRRSSPSRAARARRHEELHPRSEKPVQRSYTQSKASGARKHRRIAR